MRRNRQEVYIQELPIATGDNHIRETVVAPSHRSELAYDVNTIKTVGSRGDYETLIFPATGDYQFVRANEGGQLERTGNKSSSETSHPELQQYQSSFPDRKSAVQNHRRAVKAATSVIARRV